MWSILENYNSKTQCLVYLKVSNFSSYEVVLLKQYVWLYRSASFEGLCTIQNPWKTRKIFQNGKQIIWYTLFDRRWRRYAEVIPMYHVTCPRNSRKVTRLPMRKRDSFWNFGMGNGQNNLHLRVLNLQIFQISISSQINSLFVAPTDNISIFQNWEMQTNLFSFAPPCFDTCWIYFGWIKGQSVTNGAVKIIIDNCFEACILSIGCFLVRLK